MLLFFCVKLNCLDLFVQFMTNTNFHHPPVMNIIISHTVIVVYWLFYSAQVLFYCFIRTSNLLEEILYFMKPFFNCCSIPLFYCHYLLFDHLADDMSLVLRKPVFGVSDQVRHKPGCTAIEDG